MNRGSKDDGFEVSDSTDWIETPLPSLCQVDSALRCQVCKDFYNTPMITSCNHSFCSLCIRRCLTSDGKCPACRAPDQELKLKHNPVLEDVVEAFKRARQQVLEFARKPVAGVESSQVKRKRGGSQLRVDESPQKRTRMSGRRTRSSQNEVVIEDSEGEDEDFIPEEDLVECPICMKRMKEAAINAHLDRQCMDAHQVTKSLGRSSKQSSQSTSYNPAPPEKPVKRPERLPQINYQFVKDGPMKKKLTDMGLSAAGNRQLQERRYTEWVTLWNSNCDATRPKTKAELKRELDVWERTQGKQSAQTSGSQIKDKDFDGNGWSKDHDTDFKALIAKARAKVPARSKESGSASMTNEASSSTAHVASTPDNLSTPLNQTPEDGESNGNPIEHDYSPAKAKSKFFAENDDALLLEKTRRAQDDERRTSDISANSPL